MDLSLRTESFELDDPSWLGSRHGVGAARSVTLDVSAFTENTHYPNGFFPSGLPLGWITTGTEDDRDSIKVGPYAALSNEVTSVTITGTPTGGTWVFTWGGQSATIPFNATAAAFKALLEGMSNIAPGDVEVTGGPGPGTPYAIEWRGKYAGTNITAPTKNAAGLTGGTSPDVTIGTTTAGGAETATDGRQKLAGFLMYSVKAPTLGSTYDVHGAMLEHGRVVVRNLPVPIDIEAARADLPTVIFEW